MKELPLVTIVTPSLGQGRFLRAAIESVLGQDYPRIEYFVVDGGSSDETLEVIRRYENSIGGWVSEPDAGPSFAIAKGFERGSGEILAWLNADDILLPGAVRTAVEHLSIYPNADAVFGNRLRIDADGSVQDLEIAPRRVSATLFRSLATLPQETVFFRRRAYEALGDERTPAGLDFDYELFLKLHAAGAEFVNSGCFMGAYRSHAGTIASTRGPDVERDAMATRATHFQGGVASTLVNRLASIVWKRVAWRLRKLAWLLGNSVPLFVTGSPAAKRLWLAALRSILRSSSLARRPVRSGVLTQDEALAVLGVANTSRLDHSGALPTKRTA